MARFESWLLEVKSTLASLQLLKKSDWDLLKWLVFGGHNYELYIKYICIHMSFDVQFSAIFYLSDIGNF